MYKKAFLILLFEILFRRREALFVQCGYNVDVVPTVLTEGQRNAFFVNLYNWFCEKMPKHPGLRFRSPQSFTVQINKEDTSFKLKITKEGGCSVECFIDPDGVYSFSSDSKTDLVNFIVGGVSVAALTIVVKEENLRLIVFYSQSCFRFVGQTACLSCFSLARIFAARFTLHAWKIGEQIVNNENLLLSKSIKCYR